MDWLQRLVIAIGITAVLVVYMIFGVGLIPRTFTGGLFLLAAAPVFMAMEGLMEAAWASPRWLVRISGVAGFSAFFFVLWRVSVLYEPFVDRHFMPW